MRLFRTCVAVAMILTAAASASTAEAQQARVRLTIDTSLADSALALTCSGAAVDEAAVRASPLVRAQIEHNSNLRAAATMDAYVVALRALSACQAPAEDPFNVAAIIADPQSYRAKAAAITARRAELASSVQEMLTPYMPPGRRFTGGAVLAVPYFSCGGFSYREYFFIDIACMNPGLDGDFDSLRMLIAHETFHAIQAQTYFHVVDDTGDVTTRTAALELMFSSLLWEGMAEHVASTASLATGEGGGRLTQIFRRFAQDNAQRIRTNTETLSMLIEYVAAADDADAHRRSELAYAAGFTGGYQQFAYYVGDRMAGDIERAWGRAALVCITQLPPEQFALAHDAAAHDGEARLRLSPQAIAAAQSLAATRGGNHGFETCRAH